MLRRILGCSGARWSSAKKQGYQIVAVITTVKSGILAVKKRICHKKIYRKSSISADYNSVVDAKSRFQLGPESMNQKEVQLREERLQEKWKDIKGKDFRKEKMDLSFRY